MNSPLDLQPVLALARRLRDHAGPFTSFEPAARLSLRLHKALAVSAGTSFDRPVVIALVGGTGTGKSSLFNALVGGQSLSPVSHTRPTTVEPHMAAPATDLPLLQELVEIGCRPVPGGQPGVALIDTPDLDSTAVENRQWARRVMETADALIYVTSPEKVSNFEINREIRDWAAQKRWFFALNKIDTVSPQDAATLREHFDQRLSKLGFEADDRVRFLLSAQRPQEFEFESLRRAVFSVRATETVRLLRSDAVLALMEHAVDPDLLGPLAERTEMLQQIEDALNCRVQDAYRVALASTAAREAVAVLLQNQTWQELATRAGWIMGAVLWVRLRLTLISSAWQLGRMFTRGPSLLGIVWLAVSSVASALKGVLPFGRLRHVLSAECRGVLDEIAVEARQKLEDLGLLSLEVGPSEPGPSSLNARLTETNLVSEAWLQAIQALPWVGKETAQALAVTLGNRNSGEELLAPLQSAIEEAASEAARKSLGWFTAFMANLLPTVVLLHVMWRVGFAWYQGTWLPWNFYGMAITVFLLSLLPGYLLIVAAVRGRARLPETAGLIDSIPHPAATAALRQVRHAVQHVYSESRQLRSAVTAIRKSLRAELPVEHFGLSLPENTCEGGD